MVRLRILLSYEEGMLRRGLRRVKGLLLLFRFLVFIVQDVPSGSSTRRSSSGLLLLVVLILRVLVFHIFFYSVPKCTGLARFSRGSPLGNISHLLDPCSSSGTISLWLSVWDAMYATIDSRDGFCLKLCTSGDSWSLFANSAGWLNSVSRVIRWVAIEYIAPDAANKCWERLLRVSSSMNFISVARSRSSGSSAVAVFFVKPL